MIKWVRGKLYGTNDMKETGHMFVVNDRHSISFTNLDKDHYPPFDCLRLDQESAITLRDFLTEVINES